MDIAGYTIIEPLGQDSASTVYLAKRDSDTGRYAIRILSEVAAANRVAAKTFLAGAKRASDIDHPYLVKVHDFGEHEGRPYCVMDFVYGSTLAGKYRNMCLLDKIYVVQEIAVALEYITKFGMAHGHINLENIFIRESDSGVILGGFGFDPAAISLQEERSAIPLQAASFMSLEQLGGGKITSRSDIYSLGVVFYTLLQGKLPYQANTTEELWDWLQAGSVPAVEAEKHVFRPILAKMLQKDVNNRYASITEFIVEIKGISDEEILLADHIAVEPQRAPETPAVDASFADSGNPQEGAVDGTASGKVISLAQRLNAMAYEQQGESEISKLLGEQPEILSPDKRRESDSKFGVTKGKHTTRDREKNWGKTELAQAVNHSPLEESAPGAPPGIYSAGQPLQAKRNSGTATESNPQTRRPVQQRPQTSSGGQIPRPTARTESRRNLTTGATRPGNMQGKAIDRGRNANPGARRTGSSANAASPQATSPKPDKVVSPDDQTPTEAFNYQPYRAMLAKDRLGTRGGKPKAHPWRILALTTLLLAVVTIYMLPLNAQLQLYHEVILPARQILLQSLQYVITWMSQLVRN